MRGRCGVFTERVTSFFKVSASGRLDCIHCTLAMVSLTSCTGMFWNNESERKVHHYHNVPSPCCAPSDAQRRGPLYPFLLDSVLQILQRFKFLVKYSPISLVQPNLSELHHLSHTCSFHPSPWLNGFGKRCVGYNMAQC
jgi:hypothetical protein